MLSMTIRGSKPFTFAKKKKKKKTFKFLATLDIAVSTVDFVQKI